MVGQNLLQMKKENIIEIFLFILSRGTARKHDISQHTELSNTTISVSVNWLYDAHYICRQGTEESSGGRKPVLYCANKDYGVFLGIEICKGELRAVLMNFDGSIKETHVFRQDKQKSILKNVLHFVDGFMEKQNILGIGFSLSGIIDRNKGIVIHSDLGWKNVHLKEILERHFQKPVTVGNQLDNAAVYEMRMGTRFSNFLYLGHDRNKKFSMVFNNRLYCGDSFRAGITEERDSSFIAALIASLDIGAVVLGCGYEKDSPYIRDIIQGGKKEVIFADGFKDAAVYSGSAAFQAFLNYLSRGGISEQKNEALSKF
ncbi:MAG: ROK family protein [Treponema sp.]|jgi:hypothetical protein|nr:ROK family protein [Treponema sp.]